MKKFLKVLFFSGAAFTWVLVLAWLALGETFERYVGERKAEVIGNVADRYIASQSAQADPNQAVKTVAGLHHIEIEVDQPLPNVYRAKGVGNSFLIHTPDGNVLFDAGLGTQAAKQKRLLQNAVEGPLTHIILSHSHADHIGATKFWKSEFPGAKIITHRKFAEGQRYLKDLEQHFWNRNRLLYTFMPEVPPEADSLFAYGGITADIVVDDHSEYRFQIGGVEFVVLPTPGAEGDDNIVLWLPHSKALFSGDFFGPLFPMLPNLFTLRGEKFRDPVAYINSLDRILELGVEMVLPSHFDPHSGGTVQADIQLMRDATHSIHQQTIDGMNAGKSVWQLMQDVKLPDHLQVSQGHGKVSWNVRSIWEYYSTWFKFESTTELYPVPVRTLYPELVGLLGDADKLLLLAQEKLAQGELEQALHLLEIADTDPEQNQTQLQNLLKLRLNVLQKMLARAKQTGSNFSETGWLDSRIRATQTELSNQ
ncbi:MAG: MBL fold metallo-hydrolase [Gammaproteobacteria bacterium]|nr:MBL fold metallo-hydrolase [Gammaproteobacteria bacterium]